MKHIVTYTGPSQHTRVISQADAERIGVILPRDLEWGPYNHHRLILDDLDDTALKYFRDEDDDFTVEDKSNKEAAKLEKEETPAADEQIDSSGSSVQGSVSATSSTGGTRASTRS